MDGFMRALVSVWTDSGFAHLSIENVIMIGVGLVLLYLADHNDVFDGEVGKAGIGPYGNESSHKAVHVISS